MASSVPRQMHWLFQGGTSAGQTDRQLLDRFLKGSGDQGAEAAFAALVNRHGPLVWGICFRLLRDPGDASDAFQATFLVLARRAASVSIETSLAPWLHGVSLRVARRTLVVASRQRRRERTNSDLSDRPGPASAPDDGLRALIDQELRWLPPRYRTPLVLCYLEGLTHEEAATHISCPVGTVRSRLARGRDLLRSRLLRRGLAPSVATLATVLETGPAQASGFDSLLIPTTRAAMRLAAGQTLAGMVPASVAILVARVSNTMRLAKLGLVAALLALPCLTVAALAAQQPGRRAPAPGAPKRTTVAIADKSNSSEPGEAQDLSAFREFPPFVVKTTPAGGSTDVDPGLTEIRVTFSHEMMDGSWSVVQYTKDLFPEISGKIHYDKNQRTCVIPVTLQAGKTYALWFNTERFGNFKSKHVRSAVPYFLAFRTKAS